VQESEVLNDSLVSSHYLLALGATSSVATPCAAHHSGCVCCHWCCGTSCDSCLRCLPYLCRCTRAVFHDGGANALDEVGATVGKRKNQVVTAPPGGGGLDASLLLTNETLRPENAYDG
jgi:hypothetical protein